MRKPPATAIPPHLRPGAPLLDSTQFPYLSSCHRGGVQGERIGLSNRLCRRPPVPGAPAGTGGRSPWPIEVRSSGAPPAATSSVSPKVPRSVRFRRQSRAAGRQATGPLGSGAERPAPRGATATWLRWPAGSGNRILTRRRRRRETERHSAMDGRGRPSSRGRRPRICSRRSPVPRHR